MKNPFVLLVSGLVACSTFATEPLYVLTNGEVKMVTPEVTSESKSLTYTVDLIVKLKEDMYWINGKEKSGFIVWPETDPLNVERALCM